MSGCLVAPAGAGTLCALLVDVPSVVPRPDGAQSAHNRLQSLRPALAGSREEQHWCSTRCGVLTVVYACRNG